MTSKASLMFKCFYFPLFKFSCFFTAYVVVIIHQEISQHLLKLLFEREYRYDCMNHGIANKSERYQVIYINVNIIVKLYFHDKQIENRNNQLNDCI